MYRRRSKQGRLRQCLDEVSFLTDYALNKHLDVYAGAMWAQVTNGLASGYPGTPGAK